MKKISLLFSFFSISLLAQNSDSICETITKINSLIQIEHLQLKPVDDSLSAYIFDNLIDKFDPARNIFLKSEYQKLASKYRLNIDDLILQKNCSFLNDIFSTYKNGLIRKKEVLKKIATQPIDYNTLDTIRFYKKSFPFYMTKNTIEKIWQKKIRYDILEDIAESSNNLDSLKTNFQSIEKVIKKEVIENQICNINTLLQSKPKTAESLYTFFCTYFDPHTAYFSDDSKSTFEASFSKEHLSIGLSVNLNDKNEIIVEKLDLNGPAFKTNLIKKGDQIVSISNQKETLNVNCSTIESITNMMLSESNKIITLSLKRNSKKVFNVTIEKAVIKDEKNSVFSFIIGKESKIGYIKIPLFYADLYNPGANGCAEDVAKEIAKLQKDNINGLVIDLINNGGGSMEEAVKLAGMFIDHGPISFVVDNSKNQIIIDDPYDGMLYSGPIVVLVNSNTASASEFFTSIIQDYNRGIILGSTTLGKATVQIIEALDEITNTDFLKITVSKFYRITGKSNQYTGITPNVIIPEFYENVYSKEKDFPTAIKNDTIIPIMEFKPSFKRQLIDNLSSHSKTRIAKNDYFNNIIKVNTSIDSLTNKSKTEIPMTLDAVYKQKEIRMHLWNEINNYNKNNDSLDVYNSTINNFLLGVYPNEKTINQYQIDNLKTNPYLNEAVNIINEFNDTK